jgi:hypothetical protein
VRCEVRDHGVGFDPSRRQDDELSAGLGLEIVRSLSTTNGVETVAGETTAWFELELSASGNRRPVPPARVGELGSHSPGGGR